MPKLFAERLSDRQDAAPIAGLLPPPPILHRMDSTVSRSSTGSVFDFYGDNAASEEYVVAAGRVPPPGEEYSPPVADDDDDERGELNVETTGTLPGDRKLGTPNQKLR